MIKRDDIFYNASEILEQIDDEEEDIIPERQTRADTNDNPDNNVTLFHGYLLTGSVEDALEKCNQDYLNILENLREALTVRLSSIIDDPIYRAIAIVLDTQSYLFNDIDTLFEEVQVLADHFKDVLEANGCNLRRLKTELDVVRDYIIKFTSKHTPEKCWAIIFNIKQDLGVTNILQLVEICLVIPLSNAESERVFSFLWRLFCKERTSLSNDSLEMLLRMRNDSNFSKERYGNAVNKFLTEYPDGTLRKGKRRLAGHKYPKNRKSTKKARTDAGAVLDEMFTDDDEESDEEEVEVEDEEPTNVLRVEDISLENISDDEWSEDSSSDDE